MIEFIDSLPLPGHVALFVLATLIITIAGARLARSAEAIAGVTGIGQAIMGGLFLGAVTSLPGLVTSLTAALENYPGMAVSNALGGIAAQTAFLAIADITYRKTNLEYAAASLANIMQGGLLIALLTIPLIAVSLPEVSWWSIHPVTPLMVVAYIYGMKLVSRSRDAPMWRPKPSRDIQEDEHDEPPRESAAQQARRWAVFLLLGLVVAAAGWVVARTGIAIIRTTGLSESLVGGLFTAVSSSTPELVTSIAAVRNRAYTLAVGGIIGGNAFDTLFLCVADLGYRPGSIYHAIGNREIFLTTIGILMTAILLLGLVSREKRGIANIGFESFAILVLYAGVLTILFLL